ncbi:MAG TPA: SDR family NAD(P)-dependent oxidoreductase, partial [Rhodanobacter sp.]|nr:SDR family NAD(P)-dependent oxidoreductase [Rhodanobacter sp.]
MSTPSPSRLALVTGGLGGLGTEICRQLAQSGRRVVAADLPASEARLAAFHEATAGFGDAIGHEAMDVSDHDACATLIGRLEREHGGVDILVN